MQDTKRFGKYVLVGAGIYIVSGNLLLGLAAVPFYFGTLYMKRNKKNAESHV